MVHISGDTGGVECGQLAADRDALVHLPHLREPEAGSQLGLADEHNLEELFPALQLGKDANLLEEGQRQSLRFVDHEHGERLQRHQRIEKLVERIAQVGSGCAAETATRQIADRNHPEIDEQRLQQIFAGDEWVGDKGRKCAPVELLQHRSTEGRLAGADFTRQYDQTFPAMYSRQNFVERRSVCRAPEQKARVGRQTERLLEQSVERFVDEGGRQAGS